MAAAHDRLWTPAGWRPDPPVGGRFVVPGMPNIHSHAFQRAMAGHAERQTRAEDSFWTWREVMYAFAARIGPEALRDIAAQLYAEMLCAGYTSVCEFHYLHHAPDGQPYDDPDAMSLALVEAARETGIRLTLLPVLYMTGGFDGRPLVQRQQRFRFGVDGYLDLLQRLRRHADDSLRIGAAFHSLRAVPAGAMRTVLEALAGDDCPLHIHIAEQVAEVDDCRAARGARPVEWLLAEMPVDARWTLVHATHVDAGEVDALARSGATVALCPTTEANLGDGLFPLRAWLDAGGSTGIGSDSHVSVSPVEELRWLEYGQRLATRRRNIAVGHPSGSVGETLFGTCLAGGLRACQQGSADTDVLVLDADAAELAGHGTDSVLDAWVFAGNRPLVREVHVAGRRVVAGGRHVAAETITARYRRCIEALGAA